MLMLIKLRTKIEDKSINLNTSHVNVNLFRLLNIFYLIRNLNTSHVNVNPNLNYPTFLQFQFKYISC